MSNLRAFTMPKWGIEMTEGTISQWMVTEGEAFEKGQVIAAIETEKIVNDIEAEYSSVCLRQLVAEGDICTVGTLLAVFGDGDTAAADVDEFVRSFVPAGASEVETEDEPVPATEPVSAPAVAAVQELPPGVRASPMAQAAAAQLSVDLSQVSGSGVNGRVLRQDVEQAQRGVAPASAPAVENALLPDPFPEVAATPVAKQVAAREGIDPTGLEPSGSRGRLRLRDLPQGADPEDVPFSNMRKHIAERLTRAYNEIPHYYLETSVAADALVAARTQAKADGVAASLNDWILLATARALAKSPDLNVHVLDETTRRFRSVNLALAVAMDEGLVTPVIKDAARMSLAAIADESKRLIAGARAGKLPFSDYSGGTFTVSNLGMYGVTRFTAIINPPQAAILSVGAVRRVPRETADGIGFGDELTLTLGLDHRVIDGARGGEFLARLREQLEDPARLR